MRYFGITIDQKYVDDIIERLRNITRFVVNRDGNIIPLEIQHFDNTEIDENNNNIRLFIRNLPECPPE